MQKLEGKVDSDVLTSFDIHFVFFCIENLKTIKKYEEKIMLKNIKKNKRKNEIKKGKKSTIKERL